MKWINHIIIGGSLALAFNPALLPVAIAGSTAPDWLERVAGVFKIHTGHRGHTHYVAVWSVLVVFFAFGFDFYSIGFWFSLGALSHVLADSLTVSGVPFAWWSEKRFHLFGGRLRTGGREEYFISGIFACFAVLVGYGMGTWEQGFFPFFFQWHKLYQDGVIDAYEWKQNRFRVI